MPAVLIFLAVTVFGAFIYLAIECLRFASGRDVPPITKRLSLALGWVCLFFIPAGVQAAVGQLVRNGTLSDEIGDWFYKWGTLILELIAMSVAFVVLGLVRRAFRPLGRSEQLMRIVITSSHVDVKTSELGLTGREMEVLEAMANGRLSDEDIAEAFFITPSTAATHVRNILKKANLHDRRDLVLLYAVSRSVPSPNA